MPFIANEYAAVLNKLQGIVVTDATAPEGGRPVDVYYEYPETELQNENFPHILVHLPTMNRAADREHRGYAQLPYIPEGSASEAGGWDPLTDPISESPFKVQYPVPFDFDFHLEVKCRLQDHALQLISRLAQEDMLPTRFGWIQVSQDNTTRSLFLLGGPTWDSSRDDDGKRLFSIHYLIRIPGEQIFPSVITGATDTEAGTYVDPGYIYVADDPIHHVSITLENTDTGETTTTVTP